MGVVHKGKRKSDGKAVALKMLRVDDEDCLPEHLERITCSLGSFLCYVPKPCVCLERRQGDGAHREKGIRDFELPDPPVHHQGIRLLHRVRAGGHRSGVLPRGDSNASSPNILREDRRSHGGAGMLRLPDAPECSGIPPR